MKKNILPILFLFFFTHQVFSQSIELVPFSSSYPWLVGIENAGDSRLFMIQQNGFIMLSDSNGVKQETPFLDWNDKTRLTGEQGLLGLAFHPNYSNNGYFYIYYSSQPDGVSVISRLEVNPNNPNLANPNSETILLTFEQPFSNHNGGCIKFGLEGYLYIASGDGGSANDPMDAGQTTTSFLGKMLRIDVDNGTPYGIPPDNPFVNNSNILDEIWAYGLRNPWKFSFDRLTGAMWIGDVGQNAKEEIDYEAAGFVGGANYGWRCYEGSNQFNFQNCDANADYRFPIYEYAHSDAGFCKASVTGGFVYRGELYGDLYGKYLFADYCNGKISALSMDNNGVVEVTELGDFTDNEFTSFGEDYRGELYLTGYSTGNVYKIVGSDCTPEVSILSAAEVELCENQSTTIVSSSDDNVSYQWFQDGMLLSGEVSSELTVSEHGSYTVEVTNDQNCTAISSPVLVMGIDYPIFFLPTDLLLCNGEGFLIDLGLSSDFSYQWLKNGEPIPGANTSAFEFTEEGVYNLVILTTPECIVTTSDDVIVTTDELPEPIITGAIDPCLDGTLTYTTPLLEEVTYEWTVVGGTILSGQGTNTIEVLWNTEGEGSVSVLQIKN